MKKSEQNALSQDHAWFVDSREMGEPLGRSPASQALSDSRAVNAAYQAIANRISAYDPVGEAMDENERSVLRQDHAWRMDEQEAATEWNTWYEAIFTQFHAFGSVGYFLNPDGTVAFCNPDGIVEVLHPDEAIASGVWQRRNREEAPEADYSALADELDADPSIEEMWQRMAALGIQRDE